MLIEAGERWRHHLCRLCEENHHFIVPDGAHWNDVREVTVNVGLALQNAMRAIEQANPDTLHGIFGDASWTNKDRLSDEMLTNLIEHYSQQSLNLKNVPDDQLGNAYEYLIKEFADDSGHTAAEFYIHRSVVKLMTMIMDPQPGESIYDPTCGSGGLLLNCARDPQGRRPRIPHPPPLRAGDQPAHLRHCPHEHVYARHRRVFHRPRRYPRCTRPARKR